MHPRFNEIVGSGDTLWFASNEGLLRYDRTEDVVTRYDASSTPMPGEQVRDIAIDMTELTFDILSATLFSGQVAGTEAEFAGDIEKLLSTMGRVDPMDLLKAPSWVPRIRRMFGKGVLAKFRNIVKQTMENRQALMRDDPSDPANGISASFWVAISSDPNSMAKLLKTQPSVDWRELGEPAPQVWTDDFASILPLLDWNAILGDR